MKWCLIFILLLVPVVSANTGELTLLAARESGTSYEGTTASLFLEIKEGDGRVFLDTFPLTKLDTQISTRFARDVACAHLDIDCNQYDFIYTIRANAPIIAGPSAGAAITLLTISVLDSTPLDTSIGITGTINSGAIIGSVGGLKQKIEAAASKGMTKVLIPAGERFISDEPRMSSIGFNDTIDLVEYGHKRGIAVIEVADIDEALSVFLGQEIQKTEYNVSADSDYTETMKVLTSKLCDRRDRLMKSALPYADQYESDFTYLRNLSNRAEVALSIDRHYSAASYCFGANVRLMAILLSEDDLNAAEIDEKLEVIGNNVQKLEKNLEKRDKNTITDVEAYAVVKERLIEASDHQSGNMTSIRDLAYSFERVYSAYSWANFMDGRGRAYNIDENVLKAGCWDKIREAEERYQYVNLIYPLLDLSGTRAEIDYATADMNAGEYALCLFKASTAKAESDSILSVSGIGVDKVRSVLDRKISVAAKNIARQVEKGEFPILAYSYYEYAQDLASRDIFSALLYAEYALELSNLDMYFRGHENGSSVEIPYELLFAFALGLILGLLIKHTPDNKKRKKRKPSQSRKALLGKKR